MAQTPSTILALDIGEIRIGVALASTVARLPRPFTTLKFDDDFFENLKQIITAEDVSKIIVGMPRNLDGQPTSQTYYVEEFVNDLRQHTDLPIEMQDEAVTSRLAQEELEARGKKYQKADIDALAATYILQDYLEEHSGDYA